MPSIGFSIEVASGCSCCGGGCTPSWGPWYPDPSTVCDGVSFTQYRDDANGCESQQSRAATGTQDCTTCEGWSDSVYTSGTTPCAGVVHFTRTFTNPFSGPASVNITGSVDDAVLLNGSQISPDGPCWYYGPDGVVYPGCNCGFSGYSMTVAEGESFTLEIADYISGGCSMNLNICFAPL